MFLDKGSIYKLVLSNENWTLCAVSNFELTQNFFHIHHKGMLNEKKRTITIEQIMWNTSWLQSYIFPLRVILCEVLMYSSLQKPCNIPNIHIFLACLEHVFSCDTVLIWSLKIILHIFHIDTIVFLCVFRDALIVRLWWQNSFDSNHIVYFSHFHTNDTSVHSEWMALYRSHMDGFVGVAVSYVLEANAENQFVSYTKSIENFFLVDFFSWHVRHHGGQFLNMSEIPLVQQVLIQFLCMIREQQIYALVVSAHTWSPCYIGHIGKLKNIEENIFFIDKMMAEKKRNNCTYGWNCKTNFVCWLML